MIGVGFVVVVAGYGLFTYGWSQLHHCNAGIVDVFWPGKFTGCHPDATASGSGNVSVNGPGSSAATPNQLASLYKTECESRGGRWTGNACVINGKVVMRMGPGARPES